jgi:cellulose synthase/poly-beta-1,6-N-acetylglucosamine synthase-like glycosyltransferase
LNILYFSASALLFMLALPAVVTCVYLLCLTLLSSTAPIVHDPKRQTRFDVIVPAHNESQVIERTVSSLSKLNWPADRFRILVVADNCTDSTATLARSAGAEVLERYDTVLRGKGYALAFAFETSRAKQWADAIVVIDADAEVSSNLLEAFSGRIEAGAGAIQAHYGVLNPMASWRTRLITIAKASFHILRSRARERLGLSCGIRGNGWCVTHSTLEKVPYKAFSLTEDLEYGIDLGLAGYRVYYADEAHADADMVSGEQIARKQRQRWEQGRFQLVRSKTIPLLSSAWRLRNLVCLDLALDLLVLPLSYVAMNIVLLVVIAGTGSWWLNTSLAWLYLGIGCGSILLLYVMRGWQLSGIGLRGLLDLARAPVFLLWKLRLIFVRGKSGEWVRTEREKP